MRTIKFRAKRTDNHPVFWAVGYLVKTPITAEFNVEPKNGAYFDSGGNGRWCIVAENGVAHEIDIETVSQFTGLLDKNGKEIYEGDIVKYGENAYEEMEIKFENDHWEESCYHYSGFIFPMSVDKLEIIGNVYSFPELLQVKE